MKKKKKTVLEWSVGGDMVNKILKDVSHEWFTYS